MTECIEDLNRRISVLEDALELSRYALPGDFGLTARQHEVLGILYAADGRPVSKAQLNIQVGGKPDKPDGHLMEQTIYRMRRRLVRFGIEVCTRKTVGYYLPRSAIARLSILHPQSSTTSPSLTQDRTDAPGN